MTLATLAQKQRLDVSFKYRWSVICVTRLEQQSAAKQHSGKYGTNGEHGGPC
jgi:hypothetical protein